MKIDKVVRKDEKNVSVYFDNGEHLILSEDTFYNSGLRKGDEISDDRFSFFIEQNIIYHIKLRALSFLSRRFHSERELLLKLKAKSYDEKLIKIVLENLKQHSFLDDKNFAIHFMDEKLKKKKWGMNKIKSALFNKGVSANTIDEVLKMFEESENDNDAVMEIATKKINQLKKRNIDDKKIYQKTISFLIGRGFDYETSKEVCNKLLKQDFEE
jgi:regulatory protein